jgi:hypothetical protein
VGFLGCFGGFVCGLASGYVKVIILSLCLFPGVMWNDKKRSPDIMS